MSPLSSAHPSLEKGAPFYDSIAMDLAGYDAVAIGNYEFDFGPDVLANFILGSTSSPVPFLSANLDVSQEPRLQALLDQGGIARSVVVEEAGEYIGGVSCLDIARLLLYRRYFLPERKVLPPKYGSHAAPTMAIAPLDCVSPIVKPLPELNHCAICS